MKSALCILCCILRIYLTLDEHGLNVCPRDVQTSTNKTLVVLECCPDYHKQNGTCQECPPGKYGKQCKERCPSGKYGSKCKLDCNCGPREHCDLVDGCVCNGGFIGDNCSLECKAGTYGVNCSQTCDCTGSCDQVTGKCNHSFVTETIETYIHDPENERHVSSYVLMTSVITGLILVVIAVIKLK